MPRTTSHSQQMDYQCFFFFFSNNLCWVLSPKHSAQLLACADIDKVLKLRFQWAEAKLMLKKLSCDGIKRRCSHGEIKGLKIGHKG